MSASPRDAFLDSVLARARAIAGAALPPSAPTDADLTQIGLAADRPRGSGRAAMPFLVLVARARTLINEGRVV